MKSPIIKALAFIPAWLGLATGQAVALDDDPATAPVPNINDFGLDTRRALYIEVSISSEGTTQLLDAGVSNVAPAPTDEEPPLLLLETLDRDGAVIGSQNAWDPRYQLYIRETRGDDEMVIENPGIGFMMVPFDHRIAAFRLSNLQDDPVSTLGEFSVQAEVEAFCLAEPDNENCFGFEARDSDEDGVIDVQDQCPDTPPLADVDADGCAASQLDNDGDSITDDIDECPDTPAGTEVDGSGCPVPQTGGMCDVDTDGDVDRYDIWRLFWSIGTADLEPGDPRDPDGSGYVEIRDVFICLGECDRAYCRPT